jgi:hypothetical protein
MSNNYDTFMTPGLVYNLYLIKLECFLNPGHKKTAQGGFVF